MLEIHRIRAEQRDALARLFARLTSEGDERFFHPHPLTAEFATRIATYEGRDLYYAIMDEGLVLGYGMLRGWDEGFEVPSLGIAMAPESRGTGLAALFMSFLHAAAKRRGAARMRLTVAEDNAAGRRLFSQVGYQFGAAEDGRLVGFLDL